MLPEKPVLSIQMLEDRYALENRLLDAVNHGNAELAMQALQSFRGVTIPGRKGHTKTTTVRFRAVALNALLRMEAEQAEVHAFYLDTLYNDYLLAAGEITTGQQEQALVVEMLQQYCDRVARYSTAGYSVVIRNIIHYINLHLKENLTLSTLAARFNLSRSYLSDRLHREVHSNLTDYVTLTRIQFAANLLRYHHYTITQAAQEVLSTAQIIKGGCAELLYVYTDVEPITFNRGFYSIDMRFFYRVTLQVGTGTCLLYTSPSPRD